MPSQRIFYGWFVVAACFAVTATLGEALFSFGVFFKPLEEEFGWSRSMVSSGYTVFLAGYAVSAALSGRLVDRYRPRLILISSACLAGLGLSLGSQVNNIDQLRFFSLIAGLGSGATLSLPTATVQRWFCYRRSAGTALAVVVSGLGVGQMGFTPLINHFVISYGWRNAYLLTGILFFAIIFISSLFIRQSPIEASGSPGKEGAQPPGIAGWGAAKAMTTLAYGGLIFSACVALVAFQAVIVHIVPYATDIGMSSTAAAAALGLLGGLTIPGRLTFGFISAKIGWQRGLAISLFGMSVSLIWLLLCSNLSWVLYGFVILFGSFYGIRSVTQWGILSEFFGMRSLGALIGITSAISTMVSAGAPYLAGYIFDTTGSYFVAFVVLAVLSFGGGLVVLLLKKPRTTQNEPG